ncbi:putative DNA-binding transcriptional regulator AlpA [Bradyrhizobium japonicum]|uniref:DNA-binding transcriptional regulator AlpA n=1 Tax=Bradyrhizobium japonicum TaxID=375 RepID=A0ABV2RYP5_BRAJP
MPIPANENQRVQPRGLRRADAARYLGISPTHFDKQVRAGAAPKPLALFGVSIWDRAALDALFDDALQPGNDNEWDSVLRHDEEAETSSRLH